MRVQRAEELCPEVLLRPGRGAGEYAKQPDPAEDTQRRFHGDCPVDAAPRRIGRQPLLQNVAGGHCETLLAGQQIRLPCRDQPLQPRQLPGDLDIAGPLGMEGPNVAEVPRCPARAALEIDVPANGITELHRTGTEQVNFVPQRTLGTLEYDGCRSGGQLLERSAIEPGVRQRPALRGESFPQRRGRAVRGACDYGCDRKRACSEWLGKTIKFPVRLGGCAS